MIFANDDQQNKYYQVWKELFKIINGGNSKLKLHEKIGLIDNDLPIEHVFKIPTITTVIRSLIEKNNKFYLELSLNHCLYEIRQYFSTYVQSTNVYDIYKKYVRIR